MWERHTLLCIVLVNLVAFAVAFMLTAWIRPDASVIERFTVSCYLPTLINIVAMAVNIIKADGGM